LAIISSDVACNVATIPVERNATIIAVGGSASTNLNSGDINLTEFESKPYIQSGSPEWFSSISPQSGSLSTIIGSFKSTVTRIVNLQFKEAQFSWQPRFYDHIIRNRAEYFRMANYIKDNPLKWDRQKVQ
jgi:hypothetical protein